MTDGDSHDDERRQAMLNELLPFERAAIACWHIAEYRRMSNSDVRRLTGLSPGGARHLLCRISRIIPIYYDEKTHNWHVCE